MTATKLWSPQEGEQPVPLPGPSRDHVSFSFSGLKLKLIKIYDNYYLTPTRQLSSCPSAVWDCPMDNVHMSIYDTWPLQLLANFVSKLLSSVFALKIHFNRDNKRNSLFRRFEWRFQGNIGKHLHCNVQDKSRVTYTRILKWTLSPPSVPPACKLQLLTKCSYRHKAAPFSSVHNVTEGG